MSSTDNGSTVIHMYYGILPNNEKEQTTDPHNNLDESPWNYAEWKKKNLISQSYILSFHLYNILELTTFLEIVDR